jgi:hypothetical protein
MRRSKSSLRPLIKSTPPPPPLSPTDTVAALRRFGFDLRLRTPIVQDWPVRPADGRGARRRRRRRHSLQFLPPLLPSPGERGKWEILTG